eukprot:305099-Rhodomonas_salina.2
MQKSHEQASASHLGSRVLRVWIEARPWSRVWGAGRPRTSSPLGRLRTLRLRVRAGSSIACISTAHPKVYTALGTSRRSKYPQEDHAQLGGGSEREGRRSEGLVAPYQCVSTALRLAPYAHIGTAPRRAPYNVMSCVLCLAVCAHSRNAYEDTRRA